MATPKGFARPNHTQTPNIFFDDSLPKIKSFAELKVILAVVRQTFGWHKADDRLSISQLVKLTGLTRQGVVNGVAKSLADGFLERQPVGQSFTYSLKLVNEVDQLEVETSQQDRPEVVNETDQQLVNEVDTQKKGRKEKKENGGYALLIDFHYKRIGRIPDGKAQGAAAKWILETYTSDQAIACYRFQLEESWRNGEVSWLTVKKSIGSFLASRSGNGGGRPAWMASAK